MTLISSSMVSQLQQIVEHSDVSCNTEIEVIRKLSLEAQRAGRDHGVIFMVELRDLREGIMGASSDHLILESDRGELSVVAEVIFQLNYSALLRAMTSPFVTKVTTQRRADERVA